MSFKELLRYQRRDEVRIYCLRVATPKLELWRMAECSGKLSITIKEADLASVDEALELLEDIRRSLQAGGWREVEL